MQPCLYCNQPATIGPHRVGEGDDTGACNHAIHCEHCGKASTLSVNLTIGPCKVQVDEALPLFSDIA